MRIISGTARGRRLFAPSGDDTRPTSDRVKESLFSIIQADVPGATVLDLFGGSGALALEALSRGAASAVICDRSPQAMAAIRRNVDAMRVSDQVTLAACDWQRAIDTAVGRFSLVFLDPPYRMADVYAAACDRLVATGRLLDGALIVMEHTASLAISGLPSVLQVQDKRRYRDTAITLVRYTP